VGRLKIIHREGRKEREDRFSKISLKNCPVDFFTSFTVDGFCF